MTDSDAKISSDPWSEASEIPVEQSMPSGSTLTFSLASLLLLMTLVAMFLGITVWYPAAGLAVAILLIPVFLRTVRIHTRRKAQGQSTSFPERIFIFARSLVAVLVIAGASGGILFGIGGHLSSITAGIFALVVSGLVGVLLIRILWSLED